ncbi:MAG: cbb3-type cytochrome c oxidase subunit I [Verrucomicrobiota bacterium]
MNPNEKNTAACSKEVDATCRVPLLALFGGATFWLVLGLVLGLVAMLSFHKSDMFADCPFLTFGRAQAAANDLLLYGFVIPAALGVTLWIFSRLSQAPLVLPMVPVVAAHLWHAGVLVGTVAILIGESSGHLWLEYPRAAGVLLFAAFMLIAVTAVATFGARLNRELYPSHWFLFAALLWFAWSYSTANLFLVSNHPPRGVVQAVIGWWLANNLLFVWLALAGIGIAFYFLPKIASRPLANSGYALFGFLTLVFFGTWCGVPQSAPVPAWLPTVSSFGALLSVIPVIALGIVAQKTACGAKVACFGGPFCFLRFGVFSFVISSLLYISEFCPRYSRVLDFTWFSFGVTQWQLLGFATMILAGAIYEILPRVMAKELPFPKLAKANFFLLAGGTLLFVIPLLIGGLEQGMNLRDANIPFADASAVALKFLRISTAGQLLVLIGALCLLLNIFIMAIQWKLGLLKTIIAAATAPLKTSEVKS